MPRKRVGGEQRQINKGARMSISYEPRIHSFRGCDVIGGWIVFLACVVGLVAI